VDGYWIGGLFWSEVWGKPSSGLFSGLEHGGRQMLGSNNQGLLNPEHGKDAKVGLSKDDRAKNMKVSAIRQMVINALGSPPRGIPRGPIYRGG
jgi:hypothetical protein